LLLTSVVRDCTEKRNDALKVAKVQRWNSDAGKLRKEKWLKRFRSGLQMRHTWGSVLFRKAGTSFRSADRTFVCLMMLLILMSMSARFHARDHSVLARGEVIVYTILVSLLPLQLLMHLFTHTGPMGFMEAWQLEKGLRQPSKYRCLRYRFPDWCRWVWYAFILLGSAALSVYILSIALMFDQNPGYYCRGATTVSWIIDFIVPYLISTLVIEPLKIAFLIAITPSQATQLARLEGMARTELATLDSANPLPMTEKIGVE